MWIPFTQGQHYGLSIYRGHTKHDDAHSPAVTVANLRSTFAPTNDTLYLALAGELWVVFRELLKGK